MNKDRVLEIAQAIENDPDHYDQQSGNSCIGGFCRKAMQAQGLLRKQECISYDKAALQYLELAPELVIPLTTGTPMQTSEYGLHFRKPTPAEAVAMLRHLAETGEVDWKAEERAARQRIIDDLRGIDVPVKVLEEV